MGEQCLMAVNKTGSTVRATWVQVQVLPNPGYGTLGKSLHFPRLCFLVCKIIIIDPCYLPIYWELIINHIQIHCVSTWVTGLLSHGSWGAGATGETSHALQKGSFTQGCSRKPYSHTGSNKYLTEWSIKRS